MRVGRFYRLLASLLLMLFLGGLPLPVGAQEIPLKHCDTLPVIEVAVGDQAMLFLVDTAATSFLNLKTFAHGKSRDVEVTSWSGTLATSAREITLKDVVIGSTKLTGLKLPAVDLSAIGKACGPDDHGPATSLYLRRGPAKALRRALTATGKQAWPPLTKVLAACSPAQSSVRAAWQYRVAESDPARATSAHPRHGVVVSRSADHQR